MKKATIETYLGTLDVHTVFGNSLGYHAVTGSELDRRTWMIDRATFDRLAVILDDACRKGLTTG